ncbi:putative Acyl_transf_3 domain-containing protein [Vibrio chagasii]|nr:putative Acyl_transf_3 domain-containing protein [Vibrio chagasii]CAH6896586.1 putative Acyl_transf_3 domain-containing protein [Vibrio chagasii]
MVFALIDLKKRNQEIDLIKGFGVLCVLFGHSYGLNESLNVWIYSFHMPLFFFVSGQLFTKKKSLYDEFKKLVNKLIFPYFIFFFISYFYWIVVNNIKGRDEILWYEPLFGVFSGLSIYFHVNVVLWFFIAFFISQLTYCYLRSKFSIFTTFFFCIFISFSAYKYYVYYGIQLPFSFLQAMVAILFISIGEIYSNYKSKLSFLNHSFVCTLGLVLSIYLSLYNGRVDLNGLKLGNWSVYILCALVLLISLQGLFSKLIGSYFITKQAMYLSKNSLYIFPTHTIIFGILVGVNQLLLDFDPDSFFLYGLTLPFISFCLYKMVLK